MVASPEFDKELDALIVDALKEAGPGIEGRLQNLKRDFQALREHRELQSGLFKVEDEPTDECLLQIFSFLTLP
jgi:hypothetical protein